MAPGIKKKPGDEPVPLTVPKAECGPGDHPETALQGQVPAALRAAGFKGFNCNLQLIGQSRGDGANWQTTEFREGKQKAGNGNGHGTRATASAPITAQRRRRSRPGRNPNLGVPVIDITDASSPTPTAYLQTTSMLDPWESLKVNERRQLLAADNGQNGGGGPEIDIYDLSGDCRFPQLLASVPVGTGTDGGASRRRRSSGTKVAGRPTASPTTAATSRNRSYYAVDMSRSDEAQVLIATFDMPDDRTGATVHGLSISDDGNRAYFVSLGSGHRWPTSAIRTSGPPTAS